MSAPTEAHAAIPGGLTAPRGARPRRAAMLLLGWATILLAWHLVSTYLTGAVLPGPVEVVTRMAELLLRGIVLTNFASSLGKIALGFLIGLLVGTPVGYLMGRYPFWSAFFRDGVTIAGAIPTVSYAVMSLIFFGLSPLGPVIVVAIISAPYIAVNVAEGTERVDPSLRLMSQVYGRSPAEIRRHVDVPSITPFVFAGVRMSFAVAWKVAALTEVFGGSSGVGYQIKREYQMFSIDGLLAWMFFFVTFMLVLERLLAVTEARVLRWRPVERDEVG